MEYGDTRLVLIWGMVIQGEWYWKYISIYITWGMVLPGYPFRNGDARER